MTTVKESALVLTWNDGVVETVVEETAEGAIRSSLNTRLSVLKGAPVKRPEIQNFASVTADSPCGGIVPGCNDAMVAYFKPAVGSRRIESTGVATLVGSTFNPAVVQNPYYPYQVSNSGTVFTTTATAAPAVAHDASGNVWFLTAGAKESTAILYLTIRSSTGEVLVPQRSIVTPTTAAYTFPTNLSHVWYALTRYSGGMIVWYGDDNGIHAAKYALSGSTVSAGATAVIVVPSTPFPGTVTADVVSDGNNTAWLIYRGPTTSDVRLSRVDLTTLTISASLTYAGTATAAIPGEDPYFSLYYSGSYLLVATTATSAGWRAYRVDSPSGTMVTTWTNTGGTDPDLKDVSILPYEVNGTSCVILALTIVSQVFDAVSTNETYTGLIRLNATTGVDVAGKALPYSALQGRGFCHKVSATEIYPYFPVVPVWTRGSFYSIPTSSAYVVDPSIELVTPQVDAAGISAAVVARYGVDRAALAPNGKLCSNVASASGNKAILTYLEARFDQAYSFFAGPVSHFVELDLTPNAQPSFARSTLGGALVAGAYPVMWDGVETIDIGQSHRPRVHVETTGGTGLNFAAGTYFFTAVTTWIDAAGDMHRSSPATPVSVVMPGGTAPRVYVNRPVSFRDGTRQLSVTCTLYCTEAGPGSTFYALQSVQETATTLLFRFSDVDLPAAGELRLYSTGAANEPLLPEAPPAAWDIATIAGRCWLIDAEDRHKLWASKLKEERISWEFNGALTVSVDPQYGKLIKVVDVGGSAYALAERGIWAIGGYGPDNSGQGQFFDDPRLISNMGCLRRDTVVQVPGVGVLYQTNDGRFALFGSGGVQRFETFDAYDVSAPVVNLSENEVVYPLTSGGTFLVYNWLLNAWTKWSADASAITSTSYRFGANGVSESFMYDKPNGVFRRMLSDSIATSTDSAMQIIRGWVAPELPQGDCVIREVWLQCLSSNRHGVSVTVFFDYDETNSITRTWTADEVEALLRDNRYTLGVNCHAKDARSVRIRIAEVLTAPTEGDPEATGGMIPVNATVTYGASAGPRRRALRAGALK